MFKYTIVIAAVAVSMALAGSIPMAADKQEPIASSSNIIAHTKHKPDSIVFVSEVHEEHDKFGALKSSLSKLLTVVPIAKKLIKNAISYVIYCLKHFDLEGLLKSALVGGAVVAAGAVAAIAGGGIAAGIGGLLSYAKLLLGKKGGHEAPEYHVDQLTDFVLGAHEQYGNYHKA